MNQAEVDHIEPRSKGGTNENTNLQVLSKEENIKKGNR
jgi:filamentous hemagglutinin